MMDGWYGGWGWGGWVVMGLMMLLFWGLIISVVVVVLRGTGAAHRHDDGAALRAEDRALAILDDRFARGEIDAEEYRSRRDMLRAR